MNRITSLVGTRRRKIGLLAILAVLICAAVAIAAWNVSSQGRGKGKGGRLVAPTITMPTSAELAAVEGDLLPGGLGSMWVEITNPNTRTVYVHNAYAANHNPRVHSDDATNCDSTFVSLNPGFTNFPGINYTAADGIPPIPAGASDVLVKLPRVIQMAENAPDGCQDVTFSVEGQAVGQTGFAVTFQTAPPA
jgi:hypothetical protein